MATYKEPCKHCGEYVSRDSSFCPKCGSRSPFGYLCPECCKPIEKGQPVCSSCGRTLTTVCPMCKKPAFVCDRCDSCGASLMIRCQNPRCGELQFFENTKCTCCGKKIKKK